MQISKTYQAPEQIVVSAQSGSVQQAGEDTEVADRNLAVQKDFQVMLQDGLKMKLAEFANILQNREQLIRSLPEDIKKAVVELLGQISADTELPQGLENLLKGQRITSERLKDMSTILDFSAAINKDEHREVKDFLQKTFENFTKQAAKNPEQSAQELVQLAKQLPVITTTVAQLNTLIQQLKTQLFAGDPKLLEKQQQVLDQLTTIFEQNIPQPLQEGAVKYKLLNLPKIWVLLNALGAEQWQNIEPQDLQKSACMIKELAQSIYKSTGLTGEKQAEHSTLSFSIPLHIAEGIYYPAHIHIYHQQKNNSSQPTERQFETWLRVCVDTENIGMVESVFRLYGDNKLDVRVTFPSTSAANQFVQDLPNIKKSLDGTKFSLTDIMINKV